MKTFLTDNIYARQKKNARENDRNKLQITNSVVKYLHVAVYNSSKTKL